MLEFCLSPTAREGGVQRRNEDRQTEQPTTGGCMFTGRMPVGSWVLTRKPDINKEKNKEKKEGEREREREVPQCTPESQH